MTAWNDYPDPTYLQLKIQRLRIWLWYRWQNFKTRVRRFFAGLRIRIINEYNRVKRLAWACSTRPGRTLP